MSRPHDKEIDVHCSTGTTTQGEQTINFQATERASGVVLVDISVDPVTWWRLMQGAQVTVEGFIASSEQLARVGKQRHNKSWTIPKEVYEPFRYRDNSKTEQACIAYVQAEPDVHPGATLSPRHHNWGWSVVEYWWEEPGGQDA